MTREIARSFLDELALTAAAGQLEQHMNLISKDVQLLGVPGFASLGYQEWYQHCQEDFSNQMIKSVDYEALELISDTPEQIAFKAIENVEITDGRTQTTGIEVTIALDSDGQWRLLRERVMSDDELANQRGKGSIFDLI